MPLALSRSQAYFGGEQQLSLSLSEELGGETQLTF